MKAAGVPVSDRNAVTNPTLLVEVTSNSTEEYDRGAKLNHYKQCPSVTTVLFVSHKSPRVTVVARASRGWEERDYGPGERAEVQNPRLSLNVDELYAGIVLDEG